MWALFASHTAGCNEEAGGRFAASRLLNLFHISSARLNLGGVQTFLVH